MIADKSINLDTLIKYCLIMKSWNSLKNVFEK